jgi:hypothetical protein
MHTVDVFPPGECCTARGRKNVDFRRDLCCTRLLVFPPGGREMWCGTGPQHRRSERRKMWLGAGPQDCGLGGACCTGLLAFPPEGRCGAAGGRKIAATEMLAFPSRGPKKWHGTGPHQCTAQDCRFSIPRAERVVWRGAKKTQISKGICAAQDCWFSFPRAGRCGAAEAARVQISEGIRLAQDCCFSLPWVQNVARHGAAKSQISEGIGAAQDCRFPLPGARKCGAVQAHKIAEFRGVVLHKVAVLPFLGPENVVRHRAAKSKISGGISAAQHCWLALPKSPKCGAVRGRKIADFKRDSRCKGLLAFPPEGQKMWRGTGPQNRRFQGGVVLHRIAGFPSRGCRMWHGTGAQNRRFDRRLVLHRIAGLPFLGPENVARHWAAKS